MAEIRPFKGIRYNKQLVKELSDVVCPPYDIISPQLQNELYERSEYNFVRVELNRELPQDNAQDNRYTRSAKTLNEWLEQGVLKAEDKPAIYLHEHYFTLQGKQYKRRNIIAVVRLEEWEKMVVRPHESVLSKPKSDRMSMLYACHANTSPVLTMYEDTGNKITATLDAQSKVKPTLSVEESSSERHKLWAIKNVEVISALQKSMAAQPLYIADGHHRYDSALTYRRELAARSPSVSGEEPFNFVMMSLVAFTDPGLKILPPHRLVRGISRGRLNHIQEQLRSFFEIEVLSASAPDIWSKIDSRLTGITSKTEQTGLAVFGLDGDNMLFLTSRDYSALNQMMPCFHTDLYKKLDVSLVDHIILEELLGITREKEETALAYSYDRLDAVNRVRTQEYQLTFILNPVKPELVKEIADAGDRMPRKSTYFYPKSPAGLVFYRW